MPLSSTSELAVLATHTAATGGSDGGLPVLLFFIGLLGTPAWFIFSTLPWRMTVAIAVVAWALGVAYVFIG